MDLKLLYCSSLKCVGSLSYNREDFSFYFLPKWKLSQLEKSLGLSGLKISLCITEFLEFIHRLVFSKHRFQGPDLSFSSGVRKKGAYSVGSVTSN